MTESLKRTITEQEQVEKNLELCVQQQAIVANMGMRALAGIDLQELMDEAVTQTCQALNVEYCKVLELLPVGDSLLLRVGKGWKEGLVGQVKVGAEKASQAGYTLLSKDPVVVEDLRIETRFSGPQLLHDHGIVSGMSVIIHGKESPYGVFGTHTTKQRTFTKDDTSFLQAMANVLAGAIERKRIEGELRTLNESLEQRVEVRTSDLAKANELLQMEITGRKRKEDALQESEQRFRELAENIRKVFWMMSADKKKMLYVSPAYEQIWGRTCKGFYENPTSWLDAIHPEDKQRVADSWSKWQMRGGYTEEFRIVRPDGEIRWILDRGFPVHDKSGKVYRIAGIAEDITERKHMEDALKKAVEEKDEKIEDLKKLSDFSIILREETQEGSLIKYATHVLKERFDPDVIAALMLDKQNNVLVISTILPSIPVDKFYEPEVFLDPSLCYAIRTGKVLVVNDTKKDSCCDWLKFKIDEGGYVCVPLVAGGTIIGAVVLIKNKKGFWGDDQKLELLTAYVGLMATAVHNVRLMETTRLSAITDLLTKVYNRRFFDELLDKQIALASRRKEPLSILIIDIDHFKDFNDTYGYITGDRVLQGMASIMKASTRTSDVLTRFGGEEFAVVMPATEVTNAVQKAESIRQYVESNNFDNLVAGKTFKLTISIGVATFPGCGKAPEALIGAADKALYKAKKGGRNRVETP